MRTLNLIMTSAASCLAVVNGQNASAVAASTTSTTRLSTTSTPTAGSVVRNVNAKGARADVIVCTGPAYVAHGTFTALAPVGYSRAVATGQAKSTGVRFKQRADGRCVRAG